MKSILIIDDEVMMLDILKKIFIKEKFEIFETDNAEDGWELLCKHQPEMMIIDYQLPKMNGLDFLKQVRNAQNLTPALMITAHGNISNAVKAIKLGAVDFLTKPFDNQELVTIVKNTLDTDFEGFSLIPKSRVNNNAITDTLIGNSPAFKKVINDLLLVATNEVNVIIEGETGTGKELFAKIVHDQSNRYKNDFIPIDCGSIPDHLFESELFGHRRGSFTGATYERKGKFEEAQYGTIFFDEINNLPLHMQAKLLRSIENKSICKVGNNKYENVDIRIIAASNRNIEDDVAKGAFRDDLYYRLSEFKIDIPPLKERKDDIPLLANFFITKLNPQLKKNISSFSMKAIDKLINYSWPGNVRELKNVIVQAMLRSNSTIIKNKDIYLSNIITKEKYSGHSLDKVTEEAEKIAIIKAIQAANGNKSLASELLEISRRQLYRKMFKYNIDETK